jgi:hypothetical protein
MQRHLWLVLRIIFSLVYVTGTLLVALRSTYLLMNLRASEVKVAVPADCQQALAVCWDNALKQQHTKGCNV